VNLVTDENVDRGIIVELRRNGHSVVSVAESFAGAHDDLVLAYSTAAGAVLITDDKDFGELVYRRGLAHCGGVLLRVEGLNRTAKAALVAEVVARYGADLVGALSVVTPEAVRIRKPFTDDTSLRTST
jgi:predicted nuclease of predicted toxin-antitoxin system